MINPRVAAKKAKYLNDQQKAKFDELVKSTGKDPTAATQQGSPTNSVEAADAGSVKIGSVIFTPGMLRTVGGPWIRVGGWPCHFFKKMCTHDVNIYTLNLNFVHVFNFTYGCTKFSTSM
eukprot:SAG31_NODE_2492_length_5611_cov_8.589078_1_plen_119_part_00